MDPLPRPRRTPDSGAVTSLRAQVIRRYREPFDHILTSPEARAHLGDLDTTFVIIQLLGPIVFARLTGLHSIDHHDCARLVDDFLTAHHNHNPQVKPTKPARTEVGSTALAHLGCEGYQSR